MFFKDKHSYQNNMLISKPTRSLKW